VGFSPVTKLLTELAVLTGDPEMVLVHASTAARPHHLDKIGEDPRPMSCMNLLMISKESPYASSHIYAHAQGGALGEGMRP